ncbi:MAG: hypothetical protein L3J93_03825 [Thermoplasmata archaeon]|nr:hypothetical protein [Thermoplasmata archaeon]
MAPGYALSVEHVEDAATKPRYSDPAPPEARSTVAEALCSTCGGPLETGYLSTTNGSGLFWSHEAAPARLRPAGLEVVVPTGFMGTYSANLPGERCRHCGTILLRVK